MLLRYFMTLRGFPTLTFSYAMSHLEIWRGKNPIAIDFAQIVTMRNGGLAKPQAGIEIVWRNIINLRYVNETTLMAESEEELKSLLMKVKEESEKTILKLNIQKN